MCGEHNQQPFVSLSAAQQLVAKESGSIIDFSTSSKQPGVVASSLRTSSLVLRNALPDEPRYQQRSEGAMISDDAGGNKPVGTRHSRDQDEQSCFEVSALEVAGGSPSGSPACSVHGASVVAEDQQDHGGARQAAAAGWGAGIGSDAELVDERGDAPPGLDDNCSSRAIQLSSPADFGASHVESLIQEVPEDSLMQEVSEYSDLECCGIVSNTSGSQLPIEDDRSTAHVVSDKMAAGDDKPVVLDESEGAPAAQEQPAAADVTTHLRTGVSNTKLQTCMQLDSGVPALEVSSEPQAATEPIQAESEKEKDVNKRPCKRRRGQFLVDDHVLIHHPWFQGNKYLRQHATLYPTKARRSRNGKCNNAITSIGENLSDDMPELTG